MPLEINVLLLETRVREATQALDQRWAKQHLHHVDGRDSLAELARILEQLSVAKSDLAVASLAHATWQTLGEPDPPNKG